MSETCEVVIVHAVVRQLPHIVEIYGLTRQQKTLDLEQVLSEYHWGGIPPDIRWVDDNSALIVFPCAEAAEVLLSAPLKQYKVRPYSQASALAHEVPVEGM